MKDEKPVTLAPGLVKSCPFCGTEVKVFCNFVMGSGSFDDSKEVSDLARERWHERRDAADAGISAITYEEGDNYCAFIECDGCGVMKDAIHPSFDGAVDALISCWNQRAGLVITPSPALLDEFREIMKRASSDGTEDATEITAGAVGKITAIITEALKDHLRSKHTKDT